MFDPQVVLSANSACGTPPKMPVETELLTLLVTVLPVVVLVEYSVFTGVVVTGDDLVRDSRRRNRGSGMVVFALVVPYREKAESSCR